MIGLIIAIIVFNYFAFTGKNRLTGNQMLHIWTFTVAFQTLFDLFVEFKYQAYWYFNQDINWSGILPHLLIVPQANWIFLKWFPFRAERVKKLLFFFSFLLFILLYELVTLLPEPWGYFRYGWWTIWHAVIIDPILLIILLGYYKWVCKLEKRVHHHYK
ncbi:hypothetical protein [Neobacillus dielmonensis]|uniref:hypothetical protein n=1 Tax=Neobacillus dielmonensis TaxID=1347369 RepID=UPI0005A6EB54|nr:hypothetical protein [Neobacillus dielmonensis]